jgi:polyisoprenoid-binding protein YceI
MKKNLFILLIIGTLLSSCKGDEKVKTSNSKKVETVTNKDTSVFQTIEKDSKLEWRAAHLGGVNERLGYFSLANAKALVNAGKLTNVTFNIAMESITVASISDVKQKNDLTKHLKSSDFFDVENNPLSTFEMTAIKEGEGAYNSRITGNLTIKGVSKNISFNANVIINDTDLSIVSQPFSVNRQDWGLSYHSEGEVGIPKDYLIADAIGFNISIKLTK